MRECSISVIIPAYNAGKVIQRTVESVLKQTYQNFEIIIINDGSTDNTLRQLQMYRNNNKIRIYSKKNEGQGIARNYGIDMAEGQYLFFLDADDTIDSNFFETIINKMIVLEADMCISNIRKIFKNGKIFEYKFSISDGIYEQDMIRKRIIKEYLCSDVDGRKNKAFPVCAAKNLYSSKIIKDNDIKFKSEREYLSEDLLFNLDYCKCSKKIYITHECFYNYYMQDDSYSHSYQINYLQRAKKMYDYFLNNINDKDSDDIERMNCRYLSYVVICLKQEKYNDQKQRLCNIKEICNDSILNNIIKSIKKRNKITIKRKFIYFLIKNKYYKILNFIVEKVI